MYQASLFCGWFKLSSYMNTGNIYLHYNTCMHRYMHRTRYKYVHECWNNSHMFRGCLAQNNIWASCTYISYRRTRYRYVYVCWVYSPHVEWVPGPTKLLGIFDLFFPSSSRARAANTCLNTLKASQSGLWQSFKPYLKTFVWNITVWWDVCLHSNICIWLRVWVLNGSLTSPIIEYLIHLAAWLTPRRNRWNSSAYS